MFKGKTIVYTSGTFDLFHYNHLRMINYARALGDILIVGVSTDELVCSYKAKPAIRFEERMQIIAALKTPDLVIPQHTLDHTETVTKLNIDFPYGMGISTSNLKKSIHDSYAEMLENQQKTKPILK